MKLGNSLQDRVIALILGLILVPIFWLVILMIFILSVFIPVIAFIKPQIITFKENKS